MAHRLSTIARAEKIVVLEGPFSDRLLCSLMIEITSCRWPRCGSWDVQAFGGCLAFTTAEGQSDYVVQVKKEGSRFRALMAAQLTAATGDAPEELPAGESSHRAQEQRPQPEAQL